MKTNKSIKERLGILGVGLFANTLIVYGFDYLLYPWVLNKYGLLYGGHIMIWASLLICLVSFVFYDWAKKDWVGIETLKEVKDAGAELGTAKKTSWLEFLILSVQTDPFIVTVFMRKGAHQYNGLSKTDWKVFLGSLIVGNSFWITVVYFGLETAKTFGLTIEEVMMVLVSFIILRYVIKFLKQKLNSKTLSL